MNQLRDSAFLTSFVLLFTAWGVYSAFWIRAYKLGGFWHHLDEASRWIEIGVLISLLALFASLFARRWRRIVISVASFLTLSIWLAMGIGV